MTANQIAGAVFALIAVMLLFVGHSIEYPDMMGDPGPLLMPRLTAVLMLFLAALLILRPAPTTTTGPTGGADDAPQAAAGKGRSEHVAIAIVGISLVLYALLLVPLGFTVVTALFLFATIVGIGPRTLRALLRAAAVALGISLAIGGAMYHLLGVPLPGILL